MGGAEWAAVVAAIGAAITAVVTSLRKRQDVNVDEMLARIDSLEDRVEELEGDLTTTRGALVESERNLWTVRRTLARHGIPDPTAEAV